MKQLPDIFVVGVQKAGTTAICSMLAQHQQIAFSQPKEPMVLSRDDIQVHPNFFAQDPQSWNYLDWHARRDEFLKPYDMVFTYAAPGQKLTEGSTSYFIARAVPDRIMQIKQQAKIVIILREPVERAYSAYWHLLRFGMSTRDFAGHLQFENGNTIEHGHYLQHVKHWFSVVPRAQIHVMLFEKFREDTKQEMDNLCRFLSITPWDVLPPMEGNEGRFPRIAGLQRSLNGMIQGAGGIRHSFVGDDASVRPVADLLSGFAARNMSRLDCPPMDEELRLRLTTYYKRVNEGLDELIGLPAMQTWYGY